MARMQTYFGKTINQHSVCIAHANQVNYYNDCLYIVIRALSTLMWVMFIVAIILQSLCSALLQPVAIRMFHVAWTVCLSVCWAHEWPPVQKWLNLLRCFLRVGERREQTHVGPRYILIMLYGGPVSSWKGGGGICRPIGKYRDSLLHITQHRDHSFLSQVSLYAYRWSHLDAGCRYDLPCCPLSNAFEASIRAYLQVVNGTESENGSHGPIALHSHAMGLA